MRLEESLTLVVPTLNRPKYLIRSMKFWADTDLHVIYADGSDTPLSPENLAGLPKNIDYFHARQSWGERLLLAHNRVKTKYVAMLSDDEFFLPSGLDKCVRFLDENPDYEAAIGRAVGFWLKSKRVVGAEEYPHLENYEVGGSTPRERVIAHFSNYAMSTVWGVCRTDTWGLAAKVFAERPFRVFCQAELQFEFIVAYCGKSRVLPVLTWVRSLNENPPSIGTEIGLDPSAPIEDLWRNPRRHSEKNEFLNHMVDSLLPLGLETNGPEVLRTLQKGFGSYVDSEVVKHSFPAIDRGLMLRTIGFVNRHLKFIKSKLGGRVSLIKEAEKLAEKGVSVDFQELQEVECAIKNFHEK